MQGVLGVREQVGEQERKFYLNIIISAKVLNPFKSTSSVDQGGGPGALALNASF